MVKTSVRFYLFLFVSSIVLISPAIGREFSMQVWMERIAEIKGKFVEKCNAGCSFSYDRLFDMWEAFREPVENLIKKVGISNEIYPGLRDRILGECADKNANYCEPDAQRAIIKCGVPIAKPYVGAIIKLAKENIDATEELFEELSPKLKEMFDSITC